MQSSRDPDEIDARTDLFDANFMRAAALAFSTDSAERTELQHCCERARALASNPEQQKLADSLLPLETAMKEGASMDSVLDGLLPASLIKKRELLRKSAPPPVAPRRAQPPTAPTVPAAAPIAPAPPAPPADAVTTPEWSSASVAAAATAEAARFLEQAGQRAGRTAGRGGRGGPGRGSAAG